MKLSSLLSLLVLLSSCSSIEENRQRLRRKRRKLITIPESNTMDQHGIDARALETSKEELEDAFIKMLFDTDQSMVAIPISFGVVIDFAEPDETQWKRRALIKKKQTTVAASPKVG
jgi:predicted component of type VI protein secretion system